jgi:hypothetical protein
MPAGIRARPMKTSRRLNAMELNPQGSLVVRPPEDGRLEAHDQLDQLQCRGRQVIHVVPASLYCRRLAS